MSVLKIVRLLLFTQIVGFDSFHVPSMCYYVFVFQHFEGCNVFPFKGIFDFARQFSRLDILLGHFSKNVGVEV